MAERYADPDDLAETSRTLSAGDVLILRPGVYASPLVLSDLHGTRERPIVIRGMPGAVFDGGRTAEAFRGEANRRAKDVQAQGGYPGLWPFMDEAMVSLRRCSHVTLEGLAIRQAWPTAIYLRDSQSLTLRHLAIEDATFAIGATGPATSGILIERVRWCQDVSRDLMWRIIAWEAVHGEQPVDVDRDWRLFDGDFFRCADIRGGVTIRHCTVEHAFNAIHGFNDRLDPGLSQDVCVHDCTFSYIRDNVFEPEARSSNWWFYRNHVRNVHKPFSIEGSASSYLYIFSNLVFFDEAPGRPGQDNRAGGVFKLAKTQSAASHHQYVFNNSIATRSDYMRQGTLRGLRHWANAIRTCRPGERACDARTRFFGDVQAPPGDLSSRFAVDWAGWDIAFADDVIAHVQFPAELAAAGYGPFERSVAGEPGFLDPSAGADGRGLRLLPASPCRRHAAARVVSLPDGSRDSLPDGRDVGAFQGNDLFRWREFVPLSVPVA